MLLQVFRVRVEAAGCVPADRIGKIFSNVTSLYCFHNEHLLPQLLERQRDWAQSRVISDVMEKQAPFLKMYAEYTTNYQRNALKAFDESVRTSRDFARIVADIEVLAYVRVSEFGSSVPTQGFPHALPPNCLKMRGL